MATHTNPVQVKPDRVVQRVLVWAVMTITLPHTIVSLAFLIHQPMLVASNYRHSTSTGMAKPRPFAEHLWKYRG
jgi:hypothetical protein